MFYLKIFINIMKNNLLLFIIILLSFPTFGQDIKAKKILDKVSKKTRSYKAMKIEFTNTLENLQDDIEETLEGTVFIKKNKFKLIYETTEIFCNGRLIWTYLKDAEEVNINKLDKKDESIMNPSKLLTIYQKGYKYRFVAQAEEDKKIIYVIDLFPKKPKKKNFSRIRLKIDKNKSEIISIKNFGKDGNHYTLKIKSLEHNLKLKDNFFKWKKKEHPNIEIIDLRE